ncbi:MAG: tyrosine-protein phosphatase [Treponema sp.]|nr:tyrosine-protein phosphatase [Treponema sp.]
MKKTVSFILFAFILVFCAAAKPKQKEPYSVTVQQEFKLDKFNKQLGYQFIEDGEKLVFVFDAAQWQIQRPKRVFVSGTFNGWKKKDSTWELNQVKEKLFELECNKMDIAVPGNFGYPEFKFIVIDDVEYIETVCGKSLTRYRLETKELDSIARLPGYKVENSTLIVYPGADTSQIIENAAIAKKAKKLKDFDLSNEDDCAKISNFRQVPGLSNLYRGYHPYKLSKPNYDTEKIRLKLVNDYLKKVGIKTIITLSGDEALVDGKEQLPVFITDIRRNKSELFLEPTSSMVYYQTAGREFSDFIAQIVRYINSHEGPYYVHGRLGNDSTGVVCAVLAALCGTGWDEIAADYQKSNEMGIKEFRDYKLLQYSFERLIGIPMSEVTDLKSVMTQVFIDSKTLTKNEIDLLNQKLK